MLSFYSLCSGLGMCSSHEREDKILKSLPCFWRLTEEEHDRNHIHMQFENRIRLYQAVNSASFIYRTLQLIPLISQKGY